MQSSCKVKASLSDQLRFFSMLSSNTEAGLCYKFQALPPGVSTIITSQKMYIRAKQCIIFSIYIERLQCKLQIKFCPMGSQAVLFDSRDAYTRNHATVQESA